MPELKPCPFCGAQPHSGKIFIMVAANILHPLIAPALMAMLPNRISSGQEKHKNRQPTKALQGGIRVPNHSPAP